MLRLLVCGVIVVGLCTSASGADTPGVTAVKEAILSLRSKRATATDKADQALLDAAIKDLEERLAQVGKGDPEPAPKPDEPFTMPAGWELRFNTGKARPTYDAKTGVLKLAYDFADAKQLKDFESDQDAKPQIQKGFLTVKGGEDIKHVVAFQTLAVEAEVVGTKHGDVMRVGPYSLALAWRSKTGDVFVTREGTKELTFGVIGEGMLGKLCPLKEWYVTPKLVGVKVHGRDNSARRTDGDAAVGHLILCAKSGPNSYRKLSLSGTVDPEWIKQFFAEKK